MNHLNLSLMLKPSSLHNMELTETVDIHVLDKLINSNLLQTTSWTIGDYEFENEKEQLKMYRRLIRDGGCKVTYHIGKTGIGRVYPHKSLSLGSIRRAIRHTLAHDKYADIDMENCHPQLLKQICEANNIRCRFLAEYVESREEKLKEVMDTYHVSRDEAKNLFIILAYFGSFDSWASKIATPLPPTEFIEYYCAELRTIGNKIAEANPELVHILEKEKKTNERKKNKKNDIGSVTSYYLQSKEREILELLVAYLKTRQIITNNCVLCFDGLMIPKESYTDQLLIDLQEHVLKTTGFRVRFTQKEMKEHLLHVLDESVNKQSFLYMKSEFEKTHCKIINKGLYLKTANNTVEMFSKRQIRENYEHMSCENEKDPMKKDSFIDKWTTCDDDILAYEDMGCYPAPLVCPDNHYNTWTPFEVATHNTLYEKNQEGLEFILNHMKILCGNDQMITDTLIKWTAQMFQYPACKTWCPVLISKPGTGKTSFCRILANMMGTKKYFETTNPSRDVWGQFNSCMVGAFLVNLNEISKKDSTDSDGVFKGLITDTPFTVNQKGKDAIPINSYHRFIITTNKEDPIKVLEDDRRFFIVRCSDQLIGNKDYFKQLNQYIEDMNVIRTFYDYLMAIPIPAQFGKEAPPRTEYQKTLSKLERSPIDEFLEHLASIETGKVELLPKELYEFFKVWATENNVKYDTTPVKLGVRLSLMNIPGIEKGKHTRNGDYRVLDTEKLRRHYKVDGFIDDEEPTPTNFTTSKKKTSKQHNLDAGL